MDLLKNIYAKLWNSHNSRTLKYNRNVLYSFALKGLGIIVSLLLIPLTLGYLNNYEFGIWVTLNSILTWINYFDIGLGNGLRNKLTEAIAINDYKSGKNYIGTTFLLLTIIAICIGCIITIISFYINWNQLLNIDNSINNIQEIVIVVIWCLCANFVLKTVGIIYIALQDIWINNLLTLLGTLVSLIWIFLLTRLTTGNLMSIALAYSFSPLFVYLAAYWILFYKHHPELKPSFGYATFLKYYSELTILSVKFFILQLTSLIVFSTSNFIISKIFSPGEVTPYNIAYRYFNVIVMTFYMTSAPLWSAITNALKQKDIHWITSVMNKMTKICIFFILLSFLLVILSKPIFMIWVGNNVHIPYSLSISLAIYSSVFMWATIVSSFSNGTGELKSQLWSSILSAVSFIPLARYLSSYGVEGIVYAMTIVSLIPAIILTIEYKYKIKYLLRNN